MAISVAVRPTPQTREGIVKSNIVLRPFMLIPRVFRPICRCAQLRQVRRAGNLQQQLNKAITKTVAYHDEVFGVTHVNRAKADVSTCDALLNEAQLQRRQKQSELRRLQKQVKDIHDELDLTPRGNDRYMILVSAEREAIKAASSLSEELDSLEESEREAFLEFSHKVRISQEKEREYKERTKYWSITASLVGALLGLLGASISNELRMRKLRRYNAENVQGIEGKIDRVHEQLAQLMHREQQEIVGFIEEMRRLFRLETPKLDKLALKQPDGGEISGCLHDLRAQSREIAAQLQELKRLTALDLSLASQPNAVVYVGDDMELLLKRTEESIESRAKLRTLVATVLGYAIVGIAAPLVYIFYTGDR